MQKIFYENPCKLEIFLTWARHRTIRKLEYEISLKKFTKLISIERVSYLKTAYALPFFKFRSLLHIFPKNRVNIGDITLLLIAIVKLIKSTIKEKEIIILESISLFSLRVEADKGQSERIESPRASCRTNSIQRQAAVNGDSSVDEASTPMDVDVGQGRPDSQPCCFYATCQ